MGKTFGENLKRLMDDRNISVRDLAKAINVPHKTVQEWPGGNSRMPRNPDHLRKLADYFKVSVHFLLFAEEDSTSLMSQILEKTEIHTGLYEITIRKVRTNDKKGN